MKESLIACKEQVQDCVRVLVFFCLNEEIDESHAGIFSREINFFCFIFYIRIIYFCFHQWVGRTIALHKKTLRRYLLMFCVCVLASIAWSQRLFAFRSHWARRTYNHQKRGEYVFCDVALRQWRWSSNQSQVYVVFAFWFRLLSESSSLIEYYWRCTHRVAHASVSASLDTVRCVWARAWPYENVYFFRWFRHYWLISVNGNTLLFVW